MLLNGGPHLCPSTKWHCRLPKATFASIASSTGVTSCSCRDGNICRLQVVKTQLPWETLGAMPEMLQTAWGSLFLSLRLQKVRGESCFRGRSVSQGLAGV